jgi:hypothetical protein
MTKWFLLVGASSFVAGVWFGLYKFSDYVEDVRARLKVFDGKLDSKLDKFAAAILRLKDKF